jgi:predicted amidohydrolase YtcJ
VEPIRDAGQADTVFIGNVSTVNERQPRAEAIAVKGIKIIFVGSNKQAKQYQNKNTRVVGAKAARWCQFN